MKNRFNLCLAISLSTICLLLACESKFNEQKPEGVEFADIQLKDRVSANLTLDEKISQIEKSAFKLKNIISLFRKLQLNDDTAYTPIDLLLDLTSELKKGLPRGLKGLYAKQSQIHIPISKLSTECQRVDAIFKTLEPKSIQSEGGETKIEISAVISIKSCFSKDFVDAFEIHAQGANLSLIIKSEAFTKLFSKMLPDVPDEIKKLTSSCNFTGDEQSFITQVNCNQLAIPLSETESALLDSFSYFPAGETRLEGTGKIFGLQGLKALLYLKLRDGAPPEIKISNVEPASTFSSPASSDKK